MNDQAIPSPELTAVLREYEEIQREEKALKERKTALKDKLAAHMQALRATEWMPQVDGRSFKVRYRETVVINYDEETLRQRLGERYRQVLGPDLRKLRHHLDEVAPLLEPQLGIIGSPVPDKVKAAIASGLVSADEFKGAFEKTEKQYIAVSQPVSAGADRLDAP